MTGCGIAAAYLRQGSLLAADWDKIIKTTIGENKTGNHKIL